MNEILTVGSGALDRFAEEGKAQVVIGNQNGAGMEVGIVCAFMMSCGDWYPKLFGRMLTAVTGIEELSEMGYLRKVGENIRNNHIFRLTPRRYFSYVAGHLSAWKI